MGRADTVVTAPRDSARTCDTSAYSRIIKSIGYTGESSQSYDRQKPDSFGNESEVDLLWHCWMGLCLFTIFGPAIFRFGATGQAHAFQRSGHAWRLLRESQRIAFCVSLSCFCARSRLNARLVVKRTFIILGEQLMRVM